MIADPAITAHLLSGERVEWVGQPGRGIVFTGRDLYFVPMSIAGCAFAVFWLYSVLSIPSPVDTVFVLWGSMFVAMGLMSVFGRFVLDMFIRRRLRYAVTDRRVLIARGGPFARFTAIQLDELPFVDVTGRGRRGTIRFGDSDTAMWGRVRYRDLVPSLERVPQFIAIDDAHGVYDLIQRLANDRARNAHRGW